MRRILDAIESYTKGAKAFDTPAIPKAHQLALGQAIVALLIAFGFNLTDDDRQLIIGLAAVLGAALPISDAAIRRARAQYAPGIAQAQKVAEADGPPPTDGGGSDDATLRTLLLEVQARQAVLRANGESRSTPD